MKKLIQTSFKLGCAILLFLTVNLLIFIPEVKAATSGPLAHWKFNELTTGAIAKDSSGNGNHAMPSGADGAADPSTNLPPASYSNARSAYFSKDDQFYTTGERESIAFTDEITVAAWINTEAGDPRQIMRSKPALEDAGIEIGVTNIEVLTNPECDDDVIECIYETQRIFYCNAYVGNLWEGLLSDSLITDGVWTHVACTYDGSRLITYINGVEDGSLNTSGEFTPGPMETYIGQHYTGVDQYKGYMDDLQIYGVVLSAEDIMKVYTLGTLVTDLPETDFPDQTPPPTLADTGTPILGILILATLITSLSVISLKYSKQ